MDGRVLKKAQVNHPARQTDRQAKGITSLPPFLLQSFFLPSFSLRRLFVRPSRERPNKSESASLPSSAHELGLPLYAFPFPRRRLVGLDPSASSAVRPRPQSSVGANKWIGDRYTRPSMDCIGGGCEMRCDDRVRVVASLCRRYMYTCIHHTSSYPRCTTPCPSRVFCAR